MSPYHGSSVSCYESISPLLPEPTTASSGRAGASTTTLISISDGGHGRVPGRRAGRTRGRGSASGHGGGGSRRATSAPRRHPLRPLARPTQRRAPRFSDSLSGKVAPPKWWLARRFSLQFRVIARFCEGSFNGEKIARMICLPEELTFKLLMLSLILTSPRLLKHICIG